MSVFTLVGSVAAQPVSCSMLPDDMLPPGAGLAELYVYSQHADRAYGREAKNACSDPKLHEAAADALASTQPISLGQEVYENVDLTAESGGPQPRISVYRDKDGVLFVNCRRDDLSPRFVLAMFEAMLQGEPDGQRMLLFLLTPVLEAVVSEVLTEELVLLESRGGGGQGPPQKLWAVRGTDPDWGRLPRNLGRILPNLTDLLGESCVFEVAAQIVVSDSHDGPVSIAGHSLGGSVAQYAARAVALDRNSQFTRSTHYFRAYSFNGVGLPREPGEQEQLDWSVLYSYQVDGELLSEIGRMRPFERRQAGNVLRYLPRERWVLPIRLLISPPSALLESVLRHRLARVQGSLCECAQGRGRIEYRPAATQ